MNLNRLVLILVPAILTFALRAFPFLVLQRRELPKRVARVGELLPMAIMASLVIYCLRGIPGESMYEALPTLTAAALTVGVHIWKKNTMLSIVIGTAAYMIMIRVL